MNNRVRNLTLTALFLALGLILPSAFHIFGPSAGSVFLPMHIPVLLCGFICGPTYGALLGVITPLISSSLTGMPVLMPTGVAMMFELMTYGFISGMLLKKINIYIALPITMLLWRAVSGIANLLLLDYLGKPYALEIFLTTAFVKAIPGIVLQLILIPMLVKVVQHLQVKYNDN